MIFHETELPGVMLIEFELREDERGWFTRSYCRKEFEDAGVDFVVAQCNLSFNRSKGTLRGMHLQREPFAEAKVVGCDRGAAFDVVVDLRPDSPTHAKWIAVELSQDRPFALFIPAGLAHGFQTLVDDTLITYQMSEYYEPSSAAGVRWDDPAFGIEWPLPVSEISDKDASYADHEGAA